MWDTLPASGCGLSCPPQLKCLDVCSKFFCGMLHPAVNTSTLPKTLTTWRVCQTAGPVHATPSSCKDPDRSNSNYCIASLKFQRSPINSDTTAPTNVVQAHTAYLKRLSQDLFYYATQNCQTIIVSLTWKDMHWVPGILKRADMHTWITMNELISSLSKLSQAYLDQPKPRLGETQLIIFPQAKGAAR